jgi:hypothetical protein
MRNGYNFFKNVTLIAKRTRSFSMFIVNARRTRK